MARWARSRRISDSEESTVLLIGRNFTGRLIRPTGTGPLATPGLCWLPSRGDPSPPDPPWGMTTPPIPPEVEQVPDVHEADHVVVGVLVDGQPGVRHPGGDGGGRADRGLRIEKDDLGARHQDLADLPFPRVEDLAGDVPLVR